MSLAARAPGQDLERMVGDPKLASEDRSAASMYVPAIFAGIVAGVAGGVAWGLIVKTTDYEIGVAAWGIGFLTGLAVLTATRGSRGLPFQSIAVVCALGGILIGKYLAFAWVVEEAANKQVGPGAAVNVPIFSGDTINLFFDNLDLVFDWIDLLWVGLAVYTAWRALQPEQPRPVEVPDKPQRPPDAPNEAERPA